MAIAAKRRVVVNAGRRRTNRRRNLTAKQIKYFGTPAQKAALRNSRRRKSNSSAHRSRTRARNTIRRSRSYLPKKHRARSKNPGEILSLVLNPGGRKKGKTNMAAKSMKRSRAAKLAYRRRMRAKANPSHFTRRHRVRRARSNSPRRRYRRHNPARRRHARRSNPGGGKFMQGVLFLVGGGVGFFGSKALAQMVLTTNNTGVTGYFANAAATAGIALVAHMLPPTRKFGPAIIAGGVLQILFRILSDNTQIGQALSSAGMGDYQMQNFVTPQRLVDPLGSAQIEIPQGWGASAPIAIATAAPPGAPPPGAMIPAGVAGYNTQGFGHSLYSSQGLYS